MSRRPALPSAVRRSTQHGLVLAAAALTVLLASTVLAWLASLAGTAVDGALDARLTADARVPVSVSLHYGSGYAADDRDARSALARVFAGVPQHTKASLLALAGLTAFGPQPGAAGASVYAVAVPDTAQTARLDSGGWPHGAREAAVSAGLAARLHLRVGSVLHLRDAAGPLPVTVSGVFVPRGQAGFWTSLLGVARSDAEAADSVVVLPWDGLLAEHRFTGVGVVATWTAVPDLAGVGGDRIAALARRADEFSRSDPGRSVLHGRRIEGQVDVTTALPAAVRDLSVPMVVARSALYLPAVLLAGLALVALVLTARQLSQLRGGELALQRARGAGGGRLLGAAAAEWACCSVPAAAVAPLLVPRPGSWAVAALVLLAHGLAALAPVAAGLGSRSGVTRAGRGPRAAPAQRLGADLALLAVAVLGYLQLRHYRTPLATTGGSGDLAVDPVLLFVPVLGTAAGALLLLRLLPPLGRLLDGFGRRRTGLVLPLAGWQLGRRAARNAGPVSLMCVSVAVGALAVTSLACLNQVAAAQARFAVGADVRVDVGGGAQQQPTEYRQLSALPGVTAVRPVTRADGTDADHNVVSVLGVDADAPGRAAPAAGGVPPHGMELPGRPGQLLLDETTATWATPDALPLADPLTVQLDLEDADGLSSTVQVRLPAADGVRHQVAVPLDPPGGSAAQRHYPLRLTGISLFARIGTESAVQQVTIHRLGVGGTWFTAVPHGVGFRAPHGSADSPPVVEAQPVLREFFSMQLISHPATDSTATQLDFPLASPGLAGDPTVLPALADQELMSQAGYRTGETVVLAVTADDVLALRIVGTVRDVPGADRLTGHLLVDRRALAAVQVNGGQQPAVVDHWALDSRDPGATAAALARSPQLGTGLTVAQVGHGLRTEPFQRGLRRVLLLSLLLAPGFAVIGFTVHAVSATRARRREFALLRAMGSRRRTLSGLLWAEQAAVALFALLPGALLGVGLAAVMLPLVTLDEQGEAPYPPLRLRVPWGSVGLTAAATAALVCLAVMALARLLARVDLVRVLRAGEDD